MCIVKLAMERRYNKETLEVRYSGKSIGDVLNMTINQAVEFFENVPHLQSKAEGAYRMSGLGYVKTGSAMYDFERWRITTNQVGC